MRPVAPVRVFLPRLASAVASAALLFAVIPLSPVALAARSDAPIVGHDVQHDVSPPLRDVAPAPTPPDGNGPPRDLLENRPTHDRGPSPIVSDPVIQTTVTGSSPTTSTSWDGVPNLDGVYPPDTNGDVGPNHYVQWVNLHFQIWDKTGHSLYGPAAGNTLWSGFGGACQSQNSGDPIALYDSGADRWLMAQFTSSAPYGECVAISTTGDPTGSWYRYFFQFSTSTFYDYPHFGVWADGYYMSANRFGGTFGSFQGASAIVLDRSKMLLGQAATYQEFRTSTSYGTLLPADVDGPTPPATGAPEVFAEIGSSALHLWKLHADFATPANSTFTGPQALGVAAYNQLCPTTRSCVPQPGTKVGLDGLGDRLMYRLAYRNFGDHESLVVSHGVNVASTGTQAGVRWYEIRYVGGLTSNAATLYQQGTFAPDTTSRWLGSMAMDANGDIALGYSASSSAVYPGMRITGRLASDPLGQMTQGETTVIAGSGSQTGTGSRWGDYAMMAIDPVDDCTFWFTSEYMPTTGTAPWRTRIASFTLPGCGSSAPTAPAAPTLSGSAGDTVDHLSWTVPTNGGSSITGYSVYRSDRGTTPLITLGATMTSYDDRAVTNGTSYTYTVTATNGVGEGPASNPLSLTPQAAPATTAPSAPLNLSARTANGKGIQLTWGVPTSDGGAAITAYEVWRGTVSGGETFLTTLGVVLSYKDTSTIRGTTYYYEVIAVNSVGSGPPSNEASARAK